MIFTSLNIFVFPTSTIRENLILKNLFDSIYILYNPTFLSLGESPTNRYKNVPQKAKVLRKTKQTKKAKVLNGLQEHYFNSQLMALLPIHRENDVGRLVFISSLTSFHPCLLLSFLLVLLHSHWPLYHA